MRRSGTTWDAEPFAAWARRWEIVLGDGYVRPGWIPLLDRLARDLVALGWDRQVAQIKQKVGRLCFYAPRAPGPAGEAFWGRIEVAARESRRTCELCSDPGRPGRPGGDEHGWIQTLCPPCFEMADASERARAAELERELAEDEARLQAEEDELAKSDPEYRAYLEEFVYPHRLGRRSK